MAGSPLWEAVNDGDFTEVRYLLENGRHDVNVRNEEDQETALICAATTGQVDVMEYLLQRGADTSLTDCSGWNSVHWSAMCGQHGSLMVLIKHGACLDTVDSSGRTALMLAACSKNATECVRVLLSRGVDVGAVDNEGSTARSLALKKGCLDSVQLIDEAERKLVPRLLQLAVHTVVSTISTCCFVIQGIHSQGIHRQYIHRQDIHRQDIHRHGIHGRGIHSQSINSHIKHGIHQLSVPSFVTSHLISYHKLMYPNNDIDRYADEEQSWSD